MNIFVHSSLTLTVRPRQVFMVISRPKSKVYYCFIKLSGIFLQKDCHIHITVFYRARCSKSSVAKNRNSEYTAKRRLRCTHSEVHSSKFPSRPIRDEQNRGKFQTI